MKKAYLAIFIGIVFAASALFANPAIQTKHKGLKKDGKMINCAYCHNTGKIEKKKGAADMNAINKKAACMGAGCHPVKK
jgi:hypothetical protein